MRVKYEFVTKGGGPAFPEYKKEMTKVLSELARAELSFKGKTQALAQRSVDFMANRIRAEVRSRGNGASTGRLVESLYDSVRFTRNGKKSFSITVGGPELVDYWAMINYGGFISSGWVPGYWQGNKFKYAEGEGKQFGYVNPMKAIKGFHYILYAHARMSEYISRRFNLFSK